MVGPATCERLKPPPGATKSETPPAEVPVFTLDHYQRDDAIFLRPSLLSPGLRTGQSRRAGRSSAQLLAPNESRPLGGEPRRGEAALFHAASSGGGGGEGGPAFPQPPTTPTAQTHTDGAAPGPGLEGGPPFKVVEELSVYATLRTPPPPA